MWRRVIGIVVLSGLLSASAGKVEDTLQQALAGFDVAVSDKPYSKAIERMYIGYDKSGAARVGVAHRQIKTFKTVTGMVIVHRKAGKFVLKEALFPDVGKIKNAKDRAQLMSMLSSFKNVAFDPHAEKSAVDGISGATQYGLRATGYLNYMARRVALEMETRPAWAPPPPAQ